LIDQPESLKAARGSLKTCRCICYYL